MEGILEKPSRIPGKKTKVWSVLDDTTLSFFRENKRSSCIDSVQLSDIQSVRKVTENQFEIVTDINSQIYTAFSEDECKEWVERLSKFSIGVEESKHSVKNSAQIIDVAEGEIGEHTVEVKSARNIFESTEKQNSKSKRPVSATLVCNDDSGQSVGVKSVKSIFEGHNKKTTSTSSEIKKNIDQIEEQKSPKNSSSDNVCTTSSTPLSSTELTENSENNNTIAGKTTTNVLENTEADKKLENCEAVVTKTATDVDTKLLNSLKVKKSNDIFDTKFNKNNNTQPRRPVSSVTQEHEKTKSDRKKSHSWSTINDVRSHLNHVSISDETVKSSKSLMDHSQQNSNSSEKLNPELEQARNKLKSISNINVRPNKIETMQVKDDPVNDANEAGGVLKSINSLSDVTVCNSVMESNDNPKEENDQLDGSTRECSENANRIVLEDMAYENLTNKNRPDSGYSTNVCENGRNSEENKTDIDSLTKSDIPNTALEGNTSSEPDHSKHSGPEQTTTSELEQTRRIIDDKDTCTPTDEEDENEDKEEAIVHMRKSDRKVSVSRRGNVSLVSDENELEFQGTNSAFAFPNVRRSKKPSNSYENEDTKEKVIGLPDSLGNLRLDSVQNKYQSSDDYVENTNHSSDSTGNNETHLRSLGQDKVNGDIKSVSVEHELVENYLDIDSIMGKVKFPNIPTLPNNAPNRADLLSVHELRESLRCLDSDDEHSDEEGLYVREDPIQRLSRLVDM